MHGTRRTTVTVAVVALLVAACGGPDAPTPAATGTASPSEAPTGDTDAPTGDTEQTDVEVFLANAAMGDVCEEVFPLPRKVDATTPLRGAVTALLAGPTAEESADGWTGWFSDATAELLLDVRVDGTTAHVSFDPAMPDAIPNASTSCGSMALLSQLDATVTQFPEVDTARYSLDGDEEAFYGWLQLNVP